jgi:hypothetical protein
MKLSEYREEVLQKFVKRYGYGHIEFRDFLSQSLSDLADKIAEEVEGMKVTVSDTGRKNEQTYGWSVQGTHNETLDEVLSLLK